MNGDLCESLAPQLSTFADDELWGTDRDQIARHLAGCATCRTTLNQYRIMGAVLREALDTAAARDLSAITWPPRRVALTPPRRVIYHPTRWLDPWPVLAGATALVALLIGVQIFRLAPLPPNAVEIDSLDADGAVMVIPGDEDRMTIIWVFDISDQSGSTESGPT